MTENTRTEPQAEQASDQQTTADPVRRWTFIVLAVAALLFAWYLRADRVTPYTSQARVNALVVPIAPEVSGTVTAVSVSNNEVVAAGQELFQVDIERYRLAVEAAQASYQAATQAVGVAQANVAAAEASVTAAHASMVRARQDAVRMRTIREQDSGALSERQLESAEAALAAAQASLEAAQANRDKALEDLGAEGERNSRILQAQAALDQARLNLERATVRAPAAGVVTGVRLDRGNFAAAGTPQMTFIAIHTIWVQADFTENNLGHLDPGDPVELVFDVLPGRVVPGRVREVSFGVAVDTAPLGSLPTVNNDPNWLRDAQRYPVLIDFELPRDDLRRLKVGSQVNVVVFTGNHWWSNLLAHVLIRLVSLLTYAW